MESRKIYFWTEVIILLATMNFLYLNEKLTFFEIALVVMIVGYGVWSFIKKIKILQERKRGR